MGVAPNDLIAPRIRTAMVEAVGGHGIFTLGSISTLFESEGFKAAPDNSSGDLPESRRELCGRFHLGID